MVYGTPCEKEKIEIVFIDSESNEDTVIMSIEIESEIYVRCVEIFERLGTTFENMIRAFIKWCVIPENKILLDAYLAEDISEQLKDRVFSEILNIAKSNDFLY